MQTSHVWTTYTRNIEATTTWSEGRMVDYRQNHFLTVQGAYEALGLIFSNPKFELLTCDLRTERGSIISIQLGAWPPTNS